VISGFCPETAWRACMSRQAVHLSVYNFGFCCLNRLAGMNIRQAARQCLRLLLTCALCRVIETSIYDFMY